MASPEGNFDIRIIGERINPGFKSTKALFDEQDLPGIQALAVKQAEAGAAYLNGLIAQLGLGDRPVAGRLPNISMMARSPR